MVNLLLGPNVLGGHPTRQSLGIKPDAPTRRNGIFIEKFKPNGAHARPQQRWKRLNTRLRRSIEEGVATAQISAKGMFNPAAIPKGDVVLLTGTTAIGVVLAVREERTEQAMLHVEQRHVLMQGDFQERWINGGGQIQKLRKGQLFNTQSLSATRRLAPHTRVESSLQ